MVWAISAWICSTSQGLSSISILRVNSSGSIFSRVRYSSQDFLQSQSGCRVVSIFCSTSWIKYHIHLFSSGSLRGIWLGSGSTGYCVGFMGALMKAQFLMALYKSERILGSRSGILPRSSNGFSNRFRIILTKFLGLTLKPKSSSLVLTRSTKNSGSDFLVFSSFLFSSSLRDLFSSSVRKQLITSHAFRTVTFLGMFLNRQSLNQLQDFLTTASTVSSIISLTTVRNLLSLPKSQVILDVSCMLNQPFPTMEKLFLITLMRSSIQPPFRWYSIWLMDDSCLCLNSSRTSLFFRLRSNKCIVCTSLHLTLMSCRALTTSVLINREWKQKFLKVSSKSLASSNTGGFLPQITMSLFSAPGVSSWIMPNYRVCSTALAGGIVRPSSSFSSGFSSRNLLKMILFMVLLQSQPTSINKVVHSIYFIFLVLAMFYSRLFCSWSSSGKSALLRGMLSMQNSYLMILSACRRYWKAFRTLSTYFLGSSASKHRYILLRQPLVLSFFHTTSKAYLSWLQSITSMGSQAQPQLVILRPLPVSLLMLPSSSTFLSTQPSQLQSSNVESSKFSSGSQVSLVVFRNYTFFYYRSCSILKLAYYFFFLSMATFRGTRPGMGSQGSITLGST